MKVIATIARETVRDIVRRKLFLIFLAIAALFFAISALTMYLFDSLGTTTTAEELGNFSRQMAALLTALWWGLGVYGFVAVIFAVVWSDWNRGVVALLLTKSATRVQLLVGKMVGVLIVLTLYGLSGSLLTLGLAASLGQADSLLLVTTLEGFLSLVLQACLVFVFACSFDLAPALILWFLFGVAKSLLVLLELATRSLPALEPLTWIHYLFPAPELFRSGQAFVQQEPLNGSFWATAIPYIHAVDYSILLLLIALWSFNRRQLPLK